MGMADPKTGLFQMLCCGTFVRWQPFKPGGRWWGNERWEVERCPNEHCPTNKVKVPSD
jgi:hypothetical protein